MIKCLFSSLLFRFKYLMFLLRCDLNYLCLIFKFLFKNQFEFYSICCCHMCAMCLWVSECVHMQRANIEFVCCKCKINQHTSIKTPNIKEQNKKKKIRCIQSCLLFLSTSKYFCCFYLSFSIQMVVFVSFLNSKKKTTE